MNNTTTEPPDTAKCCDKKTAVKQTFSMARDNGIGKNRIHCYAFQKIIGQYTGVNVTALRVTETCTD